MRLCLNPVGMAIVGSVAWRGVYPKATDRSVQTVLKDFRRRIPFFLFLAIHLMYPFLVLLAFFPLAYLALNAMLEMFIGRVSHLLLLPKRCVIYVQALGQ